MSKSLTFLAATLIGCVTSNGFSQEVTSNDQSEAQTAESGTPPAIPFPQPIPDPESGMEQDHTGHDHSHDGHDHSNEEGLGIGEGKSIDLREEDPSEEELLEDLRGRVEPEIYAEATKALDDFKTKSAKMKETVTEMRLVHTKLRNKMIDDDALYYELRNRARQEIRDTYDSAVILIDYLSLPDAIRFVNTMVQNRIQHGVYEESTKIGAAKLFYNYGARYVHLAQAAARASVMTGDFEMAKFIYEKLTPDKELEELDKRLFATLDELKEQYEAEKLLRDSDPADLPQVRLSTTRGDVLIELYPNEAPSTVANFIRLVEDGFYDGLDFFQVVDDVLAISGDPLGDGSSMPEKFIVDEDDRPTVRMPLYGSLVMAKLPIPDSRDFVPNSAGTQFAILYSPLPHIARSQTVFGRVIEGFDVLGSLQRVDPSKAKKKNEITFPPDRIIEAKVINRPETLPEIRYVDPSASPTAAAPNLPPLDLDLPSDK
ncbi:peptidylprolyl isomerase [Rhodopirellula sp. MGV]|uniref:peptidylprolyl isomerase n=1 Tax=Rhodopirellula sp. MGV TaxID=2023130 RepID=UPI000B970765|nr:peptidylprolyl isomerase [Rhodopirellula sp. MGV]OYP32281.1 hypothetical protein CGZ80_19640 [Rhodopirellula sp. MGV]PNY35934.1 peptidylprolyl isomerase [Rhodopirellula baltica]